MRVLVATDAWYPQVNGVVRSYERLAEELPKLGAEISFLVPSQFLTLPCPTYPEIRLALTTPRTVRRHIEATGADFIHIATEGPLGLMARQYSRKAKPPSPPAITRAFLNMFPQGCPFRSPGTTRSNGASTTAAPACSLPRLRLKRTSRRRASSA